MSSDFVQHWWKTAYITLAVVLYLSAIAGFKVQQDAKRRGLGKAAVTFWSVAVVFFGPIFLPLYLMFRTRAVFAGGRNDEIKSAPFRLCPHCGQEIDHDQKICPKCHKRTDSELPMQGQKQCPYCGKMNPVEGARCVKCDQLIGLDVEE